MASTGRAADLAAEQAARTSYSRLIAYLAARIRDVAAAEDALADAFRSALETWPSDGIPDRPEAWLMSCARHRIGDAARHRDVRERAAPTLRLLTEEAAERTGQADAFPDERLKLLFVCAHPAIDVGARTPLMLQAVLGLDAARIASAFLVAPATMGQRLVRAKARIRDAGIAFAIPEPGELPERLDSVLDAIYAAYGTGWEEATGGDRRSGGLAEEAVWLARLAVQFVPGEAEALGLLALMLFCESRRRARRTKTGDYVPLSEQAVELWCEPMIEEARAALAEAAALRQMGRYQFEAAIQSAHALRATTGRVNWKSIARLYDGLVEMAPTTGALTGRAAALAEDFGAAAGIAALDAIEPGRVRTYQPYWALRAELLSRIGRTADARQAYVRAMGLTEDRAIRAFLLKRSASLGT